MRTLEEKANKAGQVLIAYHVEKWGESLNLTEEEMVSTFNSNELMLKTELQLRDDKDG